MHTAKLAWRNLKRNPKRTWITIVSTAFAGACMILYGCLVDGMLIELKKNLVRTETSDIQIHHAEYLENPIIYHTFDSTTKELTQNLQKLTSSPRLFSYALAVSDNASSGAQFRGVEPTREARVSDIDKKIGQGTWLNAYSPNAVVIGKKLATQLAVQPGDEIVVMGQAADGSMASALLNIGGVLRTVSESVDRSAIYIVDTTFRELFLLENGVHEIAIDVGEDKESISMTVDELRKSSPELDTKSWREINPVFSEMLNMMDGAMIFMFLIVYVALCLLLINSILMGIFERIREFGVLKALGMPPAKIIQLILWESTWQTIIASLIAMCIGVPLALWLQDHPIDLRQFAGSFAFSGLSMEPFWYAQFSMRRMFEPLILMFAIVILASFYPALKAAIINPVKAINYR